MAANGRAVAAEAASSVSMQAKIGQRREDVVKRS
jgi:hypothetical protein